MNPYDEAQYVERKFNATNDYAPESLLDERDALQAELARAKAATAAAKLVATCITPPYRPEAK